MTHLVRYLSVADVYYLDLAVACTHVQQFIYFGGPVKAVYSAFEHIAMNCFNVRWKRPNFQCSVYIAGGTEHAFTAEPREDQRRGVLGVVTVVEASETAVLAARNGRTVGERRAARFGRPARWDYVEIFCYV